MRRPKRATPSRWQGPIATSSGSRTAMSPISTPSRAAGKAGATGLRVRDVARVGSGRGVDSGLVETVRREHPAVPLLVGGGVARAPEIERLAHLGVDGVLVATALHDGRLGRADIDAARRAHPSDSR